MIVFKVKYRVGLNSDSWVRQGPFQSQRHGQMYVKVIAKVTIRVKFKLKNHAEVKFKVTVTENNRNIVKIKLKVDVKVNLTKTNNKNSWLKYR